MRVAVLSLVLLACGPTPPRCVTKCGLRLFGDIPEYAGAFPGAGEFFACAALQDAEDVIRSAFGHSTDDRVAQACEYLSGSFVTVHEGRSWPDPYRRVAKVSGLTDCSLNMPVATVNAVHPLEGSLAHELAHSIQRCRAPLPVDQGRDADHANWDRDGIQAAEDAVRREFRRRVEGP